MAPSGLAMVSAAPGVAVSASASSLEAGAHPARAPTPRAAIAVNASTDLLSFIASPWALVFVSGTERLRSGVAFTYWRESELCVGYLLVSKLASRHYQTVTLARGGHRGQRHAPHPC